MKKTEITKNAIINSTLKLLKANGRVTVKEISEDAGVNIAAINYHFTDKKTLLSVVMRRVVAEFKKIADNLVASLPEFDLRPEEIISEFFNACHNSCVENAKVIAFMLSPENEEYGKSFNKSIYQVFSPDSEFCFKVIDSMRSSSLLSDEELKAKYLVLLSAFIAPFFSMLNVSSSTMLTTMFNLDDPILKQYYIKQMVTLIMQK